MADRLKVLVTGITGKQGGAVAWVLKNHGHQVRGLTRNATSDKAQELKKQGFDLVEGDFGDAAALDRALHGVDAAFAMSTPFEAGMEAEAAQGKAIADAAKKAGVYLVYTSVASADRNTGIPHFESKYEVEKYLRQIGVDHAIIAPVYFMENLYFPQTKEALLNGTYASPLPAKLTLQQVALSDIGDLAALIIEQRDRFLGQRIEIASDVVSGEEEAKLLGQAMGKEVAYYQVPMDQIRAMSEDFAIMYQWFIDEGYSIDIDGLHDKFPEVKWHSFKTWAKQQQLT